MSESGYYTVGVGCIKKSTDAGGVEFFPCFEKIARELF